MKVTITARKMQVPQSFPEYAEKRLDSKLSKFFGDEADAKITMTEHKDQIILELTVRYNNMIYRAERTAEDKNDALDSTIDKIIRQIRKNKTKIEKRLKDTAFKESYGDSVDEQVDYEVIKHKTFVMRPMDIDEAILQMNMLGHSFFMFCNAKTGGTNVVYKREDGNYAVLEPTME
ncbi:MAG: ribosome hibernation-promoting factor, HPF/YfiA family [Porcipelethomonas sp.]|jgi:putative sigma-54 modulation protein